MEQSEIEDVVRRAYAFERCWRPAFVESDEVFVRYEFERDYGVPR